jgi:branched-chain amino acid transport system substrate-binding protein
VGTLQEDQAMVTNGKDPWRRRGATLVLALSALVVGACGSSGGSSSSPSGGGSGSGQTVKILFSAPLSGDNASYGNPLVKGAEFAATYINNNGGISGGPMKGAKVVIEPIDDQTSTQVATTIAAKYVSDQSYWALAGFITSGQAQAAGTVAARENGLLVWAAYASADFLTDAPPHNIVVVGPRLDNVARAAVDYAVKAYGAKKIGVIGDSYSYMDSYYVGLDDTTKALGVTWTKQVINSGNTVDYSPYISNLQNAGVDLILGGLLEPEAGPFVTQLRRAGSQVPFVDMTGAGWGDTYLKAAGQAAIGTVAYDAAPLNPKAGTFAAGIFDKFKAATGNSMQIPSMYGFDTISLIAADIGAGAKNRGDMKNFLFRIAGEGVLGPLALQTDLRSQEKTVTFSKITGTTLTDRTSAACYTLNENLTVTKATC